MLKYILQLQFLLILLTVVAKAQTGKPKLFQARIMDCANGESIAYADIYNESARKGVFADSSGFFRMQVEVGDTLIIQSMGYVGRVFFIADFSSKTIDTLELCPQGYELGEVQIDLQLSYKAFQKKFLEIEPDRGLQIEGMPKAKLQDIPQLLDTNFLNSNYFAIFSPVSYLYYKYSREEISKRKVFYLERQKREQFLIDKKYNRGLIERMTGLMGDSITDFMAYCNFSHKFLYEATELEILEEIDKKFREYTEMNKSVKLQDQ